MSTINIFYSEPDPDRWFPYDRYLRSIVRRFARGKPKIGGQQMVAINLMKGLDKLGVSYRYNDYKYLRNHPKELACVIGKPHLIFEKKIKNPILFGASVYSHPIDCPDLFEHYPNVKKILVPGEWMRSMCEPYYSDKVIAWPVGIDTESWCPTIGEKPIDFLIYDKIRWKHDEFEVSLINPMIQTLKKSNCSFDYIRYGQYKPEDLHSKVQIAKAVIFLCEHETQGLAYQQILATDTPILAWDRGGFWEDPFYFPHKVKYEPVSSVPYWDDRCGLKFKEIEDFDTQLKVFLSKFKKSKFNPRKYVLENLTLEKCAQMYIEIVQSVNSI